jgi:ribosomal protein S18 acetylase RimI-like enzyme
MQIVRIERHNIELLSNVAADVFDAAIDSRRVADYVAASHHIMLVAVRDRRVIGQVLAVVHRHPDKPSELYIDDLGVAEDCHRQGVATQLLKRAIVLGKQSGCEEIWVGVEPDNEIAKTFYKSLGLKSRAAIIFESEL